MDGGNLQAMLFLLNRPEPIRQSSLLMVLATGLGDPSTLLSGLKALAIESGAPWSSQVNQLRLLLEQGQTLSEALTSSQGLLPESTLIAIRVGEQTGTLKQVLADEAHRLMDPSNTANPVQATLPNTVVWVTGIGFVMLGIVSFIMVFIIPKFKKIFEDFGVELPGPTITLIGISDVFVNFWILVTGPLLAATVVSYCFFIWMYLQRLSVGRIVLAEHFPRYWTPLIIRLLGVTVAAEESIGDGLHAVMRELRPGVAARRLSTVRQKVNAGENCWEALYQGGFLTDREVTFLHSADRSRHLDWGCFHLAKAVQRRQERWVQRLAAFIQPVVVLAVGLLVAFVCVSMFMPLVKLINDLS